MVQTLRFHRREHRFDPWLGKLRSHKPCGAARKKKMRDAEASFRPPRQSAAAAAAKSLQSCLTLCDPRDGSPPGSPVPGILQARTLEWVAISFSSA